MPQGTSLVEEKSKNQNKIKGGPGNKKLDYNEFFRGKGEN